MKKQEKSALIKIDQGLHKIVKEYVKQNKMQYPSIKHFVEQSLMHSVGFKKFDIEGVDYRQASNKPLSDVVGESSGGYFVCAICSKVLMRDKKSGHLNTCPKCTTAISQVIEAIRKEKEGKNRII